MSFVSRFKSNFFLRAGLGLMYLYSGLDLLRHPSAWTWALRNLPSGLQPLLTQIGETRFLMIQGSGELVISAILLLWFLPARLVRWTAFLVSIEMAVILWLVGLDAITFRDIGLLGAALALWANYRNR